MKPWDVLKLSIQIVGVYFLYQSANLLIEMITSLFVGARPTAGHIIQMVLRLTGALYFLRGAPPFLAWADRNEKTKL